MIKPITNNEKTNKKGIRNNEIFAEKSKPSVYFCTDTTTKAKTVSKEQTKKFIGFDVLKIFAIIFLFYTFANVKQ